MKNGERDIFEKGKRTVFSWERISSTYHMR